MMVYVFPVWVEWLVIGAWQAFCLRSACHSPIPAVLVCCVEFLLIFFSRFGITGGGVAFSFSSGSSAMLITAFTSLNWLASLQIVRPSVTRLALIREPWMLYTT